VITTVLLYIWVIVWISLGIIPIYALIVLLTLPLALKAVKGALNFEDMQLLMPAMANNVLVMLLFQLLLGIGYILGKFLM
jgi:1,4-dihydroxy-2-naphthoate octaprenyltransferase